MSSLLGMNGGEEEGVDLTLGLVAHYLLNNNADDSFGTFDGIANGVIDFQGDKASFDSSDTITLPNTYPFGNTNGIEAFSFWVDVDSGQGIATYSVSDSIDRDYFISIAVTDTLAHFGHRNFYTNDTYTQATFNFSDGKYHHLFYQREDNKRVIYIDGIKQTTIDYTEGVATLNDWFDTFTPPHQIVCAIGKNRHVSPSYSTATMSNMRLYNEVKDQAFIDALYAEGYYPKPLPLPTTEGLVAHYPLTGTAEDTTGNYDSTEVGGLSYVNDTEFGSTVTFNGATGYIDLSTLPDNLPNKFSFSFWLDRDNDINTQYVFMHRDDNTTLLQVNVINTGAITLQMRTTTYSIITKTSIATMSSSGFNLGTITIDLTLGELDFYINGVHDTNQTFTMNNSFNSTRTYMNAYYSTSLVIGSSQQKLRNLRFYDSILTTQQITDIYNYEKNFRHIDIDDGLVAYYPLAQNSLDNYSNEYDGVDTDVTYDGLSATFNGSTSYIALNSSMGVGTEFTFNFWIKSTDVTTEQRCAYSSNADNVFVINRILSSKLNMQANGTPDVVVVSTLTTLSNDTWYMGTFIYRSGGLCEIYLDGVFENSVTAGTFADLGIEYGHNIGTTRNGSGAWLDGNIKNYRVYNKAITAEQVAVIYNTEKGDFE